MKRKFWGSFGINQYNLSYFEIAHLDTCVKLFEYNTRPEAALRALKMLNGYLDTCVKLFEYNTLSKC